MENLTTVIVIGIYTVIYLIVFFVQKSQISQVKEINASMKNYTDIFKIDELKKFVKIREENITYEISKMFMDKESIMNLIRESFVMNYKKIQGEVEKVILEKLNEANVAVFYLMQEKTKEEKLQFIHDNIVHNKEDYIEFVEKEH